MDTRQSASCRPSIESLQDVVDIMKADMCLTWTAELYSIM